MADGGTSVYVAAGPDGVVCYALYPPVTYPPPRPERRLLDRARLGY